ncbi:hypothetical protein [Mycobacterium sp. 050134]|uniref:hypothetical protein n=1 Tax=Mycobacterium sp. 050134 TaxID=3096111 RepID=UPI002EDB652D
MGWWGDGRRRRRRPVVAAAAILGVFVALIAGSALRPQFSAAAPPEPAAWSHAPVSATKSVPQTDAAVAHAFSPQSAPAGKKPFHSMWMTRDRPASWARVSPPWFRAPVLAPDNVIEASGYHPDASTAGHARTNLTRLCVARR